MFSPDKIRHVHVLSFFFFSVTISDTLIKIKHDQCWTGSDTIRASQIRDGKWLAEGGFSVTNLGNLDKIRHDQGWLAEGGFSVTNLGNLDRIRHDQGWLAEG